MPAIKAGATPGAVTPVLQRPGRVPGPTRLLVVGDSVPYLLAEALLPAQAEFGLVVANRALPACSPSDADAERIVDPLPTPPDCLGLLVEDAAAFDPDIVVASFNGDVGLELSYDGVWGTTCAPAYQERLEQRLRERLPAFTDRGARVFLFSPLLPESPIYRVDEAPGSQRCLAELEQRVAEAVPGVSTVGFGEWVCPELDEKCRTELDGNKAERADGVHFTGADAMVVWRLLLPDLLQDAGVS